MAIKLVIFDFDGVLVDSEFIAGQVINEQLQIHGVTSNLDRTLRRFVGMHDIEMREHLSKDVGEENIDQFLTEVKELSLAAYHQRLKPMPRSIKMLEQLNLPVCIGSNSSLASLKNKLHITKLNKFFSEDRLYVGSMVPRPKPAPDLYMLAAKIHQVEPQECLVIEDSARGINAAVAANMNVIGFYGASHCYEGYEQKLKTAGASILCDDLGEINKMLSIF